MKILHPKLGDFRIVLIIPCYNEELSILNVINDYRKFLPNAEIYIFDNNSSDRTSEVASAAGVKVLHVPLKGKGNVVRRAFADVDADIYVMTDGDSTYDASSAPNLINKLINENLDMVVGCRVDKGESENFRFGHRFGNPLSLPYPDPPPPPDLLPLPLSLYVAPLPFSLYVASLTLCYSLSLHVAPSHYMLLPLPFSRLPITPFLTVL